MKSPAILLLFFVNAYSMRGQSVMSLAGEYYLKGVRETASGFKLNADSSFEFFFSQGALDRYGKGRYHADGDYIIFRSDSIPKSDFSLSASSKQPGKSTIIQIDEVNRNLMPYIYVRVLSGTTSKEGNIDSHGYFKYDGDKPDSIQLVFEFCPEKIAAFNLHSSDHNLFQFKIEPWLFEYFFREFRLKWADGVLTGGHPLLRGEEFRYTSQ